VGVVTVTSAAAVITVANVAALVTVASVVARFTVALFGTLREADSAASNTFSFTGLVAI